MKKPQETKMQKEAFEVYYNQDRRSMLKVAELCNKSEYTVQKWSRVHQWQKKIEERDELEKQVLEEQLRNMAVKRTMKHLQQIQRVQEVAGHRLEGKVNDLDTKAAGDLMLKAVEVERTVLHLSPGRGGSGTAPEIGTQNNLIIIEGMNAEQREAIGRSIHRRLEELKPGTSRRSKAVKRN